MEGEWKESEREEIITTDLNYHLQTRELAAQKGKKKKSKQHKAPNITNQPPKNNKIHKIPRENNLCIFK